MSEEISREEIAALLARGDRGMTREEAYRLAMRACEETWNEKTCKQIKEALEKEPFMNKPCVAHQVCHEDKVKVLDKIRAEVEHFTSIYTISRERGCMGQVELEYRLIREVDVLQIIDKYKAESEDEK